MNTQANENTGRVAIVTGASRGIGAAIALRLARDGAKVAITFASSPAKADAVVSETSAFGGTAILIMVSVALTTVKQIESQLLQSNYEGLLR